ncbi:MAG TPA: hypothetical protein VI776_13965 [Anaerolineales bacterium]|jgi:hypothetical protein|nr:hypothetical protein [Anaerolineales bacterium]
MDQNHHIWRVWANQLHTWGVHHLVATFLEVAGPLTIFGAQAMYLSQPFLYSLWPEDHWQALTNLLEEDQQAQVFAAFLRETEELA